MADIIADFSYLSNFALHKKYYVFRIADLEYNQLITP